MWCSSSDKPDPATIIPEPHHRIVRIPPGESVVLNSAERAPYLLLIEILHSDLEDSTIHGTGLPGNIGDSESKSTIKGPLLVQIVDMDEQGVNAFDLLQTYHARIDYQPDESHKPIPTYTRKTLSFTLSDGYTAFKAAEQSPLPQLNLAETPLGAKVSVSLRS